LPEHLLRKIDYFQFFFCGGDAGKRVDPAGQDVNWNHVQTIEEISTETAVGQHSVLCRCRFHPKSIPDRNALDDHVPALDLVGLVDFGYACFSDNMHPAVYHRIGAMFSDLGLRVDSDKLAMGFILS
jgi:hypothetical protein